MTMTSEERNTFGAVDYVFFVGLFSISALAGIYHFLKGKRPKTLRENNKARNPIPVACSVLVTVFTSITYMGVPAEAYIHGPMYWLMALHKPLLALIAGHLFLPVFYRLKITNIYDYLELRFNVKASYCGKGCNFIFILLNCGVLIYGPAIALGAVTGLKVTNAIFLIGIVCTLYTLLGGIRAVFWADLFQIVIMMIGFLATVSVGSMAVGGKIEVWNTAKESGRNNYFDFSPDPTLRTSFWSCTIGGTFVWVALIATNQQMMQRFLICRTENEAKIAVWIGAICIGLVEIVATYTGITMFAFYKDCDPYTSGKVESPDQLMPYFMVNMFKASPGISGIVVYAAFSASLTFVTTGINALAKNTLLDIERTFNKDIPENVFTTLTKVFSIVFCSLSLAFALATRNCNSLLEVGISITGILNGPILGLFSLGLFIPWSNSTGAIVGALSGLLTCSWIKLGNILLIPTTQGKPLSIELCTNESLSEVTSVGYTSYSLTTEFTFPDTNQTLDIIAGMSDSHSSFVMSLYSISYLYYCFIGWFVTIIIGWTVSMLTTPSNPNDIDPRLMISVFDVCCGCLPGGVREYLRCGRMKLRTFSGIHTYTQVRNIERYTPRNSLIDEKDGIGKTKKGIETEV